MKILSKIMRVILNKKNKENKILKDVMKQQKMNMMLRHAHLNQNKLILIIVQIIVLRIMELLEELGVLRRNIKVYMQMKRKNNNNSILEIRTKCKINNQITLMKIKDQIVCLEDYII